MKKIMTTAILLTAIMAFSMAGTQYRPEEKKKTSMAEEDFRECTEIRIGCTGNFWDYCQSEYVMILDAAGNEITFGRRAHEAIREFLRVSDYLTQVQAVDYYLIDEPVNQSADYFTGK